MTVRIIPGAVTPTSIKGIVLSDEGAPALLLDDTPLPPLTPMQGSPAFQKELASHGVRLYTFACPGLTAGTEYRLRAASSSTVRVRVRTLETDPDEVTFVVSSCYYGYFKKDAGYLTSLLAARANRGAVFKLLIGDNLYLDVAPDQRSFAHGYKETVHRYLHYFWRSGYADVLSELPTLTTWDDHEFWNNYPEEQVWLSRSKNWPQKLRDGYIKAGDECLDLFQAQLNPAPVAPPGRSYRFNVGKLSFFMADVRSGRTAGSGRRMFRGAAQDELAALETWARTLCAPGVLVVGQPLWMGDGDWKDYNPPSFEDEYARIWQAIASAPFQIVIVSGDVHHSRLLEIGFNGGTTYEFVTSPACSIPTIASTLWKYGSQDRGEVNYPPSVKLRETGGKALGLRVARYIMGTEAPNTIGLLTFKGLRAGPVRVGAEFIDMDAGPSIPARGTPAAVGRWLQKKTVPSGLPHCRGERLFDLRRT